MVRINVASEELFASMAQRLGRMIDEIMTGGYVRFSRLEPWKPAVNLYETTCEFVICVDISGMDARQIDVQAQDGRIVIRGERKDPQPEGAGDELCIHMMEIDSGPFHREVRLPRRIDPDRVRAHYREGLLSIFAPKTEPGDPADRDPTMP